MFETTPSDKVRFRALGELPSPGTCLVCGSGTREEGYVDLGVYLEFVGEGLICYICIIQVGELIGMMIPDEVSHIHTTAQDLATENASLKAQLEASNERLSNYDSLFTRAFGDTVSNFGSASDPGQPTLDEVIEPADSGESEVTESDSGNGESGSTGTPESDHGSKSDERIPTFRL